MKNKLIYLLMLLPLLGITSCEQQFTTEVPEIVSLTYDPMPAIAGTSTTFTVEAKGDLAVLWSGTATSDFDLNQTAPSTDNRGSVVNLLYDKLKDLDSGVKAIIYKEPGTYKVVVVVSNVGYKGEVIEQVTKDYTVVIEAEPVK